MGGGAPSVGLAHLRRESRRPRRRSADYYHPQPARRATTKDRQEDAELLPACQTRNTLPHSVSGIYDEAFTSEPGRTDPGQATSSFDSPSSLWFTALRTIHSPNYRLRHRAHTADSTRRDCRRGYWSSTAARCVEDAQRAAPWSNSCGRYSPANKKGHAPRLASSPPPHVSDASILGRSC